MPILRGREIELKIVYYGPALCGKTTNVQKIHEMMRRDYRGRLMSMNNVKDDRTIFFDLLPIKVPVARGFSISAKLYTVPGQVAYNNTRKIVLQNADGIVFVADSQRSAAQANAFSFQNLRKNLQELRIDPDQIPFVMQFNKRDLPDVRPMEELEPPWRERGVPVFAATATTTAGVLETLEGVLRITYAALAKRLPLVKSFGLSEQGFVAAVMKGFETAETANSPGAPSSVVVGAGGTPQV